MGVIDKLRQLRWQAAGHYSRPLDPAAFTAPLAGGRGLEVGGPSALFGAGGLIPVYPLLRACDGVQFAERTIWHELDVTAGYVPDGTRSGELRITDGVDLDGLDDDAYDVVFSSHVIEHFANPLRAMAAWQRVLRPGGHVLIVAPHHEGTFDHRRAVTPVAHLIEDRDIATGEDDTTHVEEAIALHDLRRDVPEATQTYASHRRDNLNTRVMHHHVFDTAALLALLDAAGLQILAVEVRFPHDIYTLARFTDAPPDNARWFAADAPWRAGSPFRADKPGRG